LDTLPPNLVSRRASAFRFSRQIFERPVCQPRRVVRRHPAKHSRGEIGVVGQVAGPLPRLGCEDRPLRKLRREFSGLLAQRDQFIRPRYSGITRRQPDSAPKVRLAFGGKRLDGRGNEGRIAAVDKPPRAPEPLIERPAFVTFQTPRRGASLHEFWPMEKSLVKSPAIECQPSEHRIEPSIPRPQSKWQSRPNPPHAHVDHVRMPLARTAKEIGDSSCAPGSESIEQRETHRRAFEGEAAQLGIRRPQVAFEFGGESMFQRAVIASHETCASFLQSFPHRRSCAAKTAAFITRLLSGQSEQKTTDWSPDSLHRLSQ
jgi:hypothetical protein